MPVTPGPPRSPLPKGRLRFSILLIGVVGLAATGCSGASSGQDEAATATPPRVSPDSATTIGTVGAATTIGPARITVPSALTVVDNVSQPAGQRVAVFRSTADATGQSAVLTITVVDQPGGRTAQSEAQSLAVLKRAVHKAIPPRTPCWATQARCGGSGAPETG